jgi:hypothetical protein
MSNARALLYIKVIKIWYELAYKKAVDLGYFRPIVNEMPD